MSKDANWLVYAKNMASSSGLLWCVYIIRLFASHKVYIGSTAEWPRRGVDHIQRLEKQNHHNVHLQRAFDAYGCNGMSIEILEEVSPHMGQSYLRLREEYWIEAYSSADNNYGYNIAPKPTAGTLGTKRSPGQRERMSQSNKQWRANPVNYIASVERITRARSNGFGMPKTYVLYDPKGEQIEITNLKAFCEAHGLDESRMHAVARGKAPEHQGWKLSLDRKHEGIKSFRLMSPEGDIFEGSNVLAFCRERGLKASSFYGILNGSRKKTLGWTVVS